MATDPPATPATGLQADRIFLSNHVRVFEVGAYPEERGVTQHVRFDVTLEVARKNAPFDDKPAEVVSYIDLVDAIEALIVAERINLLETFAERLAARCLGDPRARRVHVRIEKLDRLDGGGLGVEIVRDRAPDQG